MEQRLRYPQPVVSTSPLTWKGRWGCFANHQACSCRDRGAPEDHGRGTRSESATRINGGQALAPRFSGGRLNSSLHFKHSNSFSSSPFAYVLTKPLIAHGVILPARHQPSSTLATTLSWPRHFSRNLTISHSSANARAWHEHEQDPAHSWRNVNRRLLTIFYRSSSPTTLGDRRRHQASETRLHLAHHDLV